MSTRTRGEKREREREWLKDEAIGNIKVGSVRKYVCTYVRMYSSQKQS